MPGATADKPVRQDFSKAPESTGNEIATVRFDFEFRRHRFAPPRQKRFGQRNDDFADVLSGSHESKGRADVVPWKCAEWQRMQDALPNEVGDLRQHFPRE